MKRIMKRVAMSSPMVSMDELSEEILSIDVRNVESIEWDQKKSDSCCISEGERSLVFGLWFAFLERFRNGQNERPNTIFSAA